MMSDERTISGVRAGAAAGLVGAAGVMVLTAVVHTVAPPVPFLPESIAQSLVRAAPGGFATSRAMPALP